MLPRSWFALGAGLGLFAGVVRAGILDDLGGKDAERVRDGEQVIVTEEVDGMPWPRVTAYEAVPCPPEETMAVFFDYDNAAQYVPNCLESKISSERGPRDFEVDYKIDVPMLADEAYTARNVLAGDVGGAMVVSWELIRATSVKRSEGELRVEPLGSGTVLRYRNFVEPSSIAAPLLRGVAIGQMGDTLEALVKRVEQQHREDPEELARQVERLRAALGR